MARVFLFLLKTIIPLIVLFGGFLVVKHLLETGPEPRKRPPVDRTPVVEVKNISQEDYTINLDASGIVKARSQTSLVSQVAGKIIEIAPNFRPGAYVEEGDELLVLDDSDYVDAINIARSNIAANEAAIAQLDQEERNTLTSLKLAQENMQTVQQNLDVARRNINNVQRKAAPLNKNTGLIKRNIQLARQNYNLTRKNLELAKNDLKLAYNDLKLAQRNLDLANKEMQRLQQLQKQRLIAINQVDTQQRTVLQQQQQVSQQRQQISQKQQQIVQLEQNLVQQQQSIVQQEQQLTQQDQSLAQQDQNVLSQQQQVLQQQQALIQQKQNVANLEGTLATFESRRNSLRANNDLTRTQLQQQQRNLERTRIYAPYTGRILEQRADLGQYVSPNSVLGSIYATDYVEVDMPLTLKQFALLDMPEDFAGEDADLTSLPLVEFTLPFDKSGESWSGYVTGTRASLNEQSRQITVVARIDNPDSFGGDQSRSLKIGQYLNARIEGRTFEEVYVLPPVTVRQNREVLQMIENKVHIAPIEVIWSTEEEIVVSSDEDLSLDPLIVTALGQATEGLKVALPGQKKKPGRPGGKPGGAGKPENASLRDVPQDGKRRRPGNGEDLGNGEGRRRPPGGAGDGQGERRRRPPDGAGDGQGQRRRADGANPDRPRRQAPKEE